MRTREKTSPRKSGVGPPARTRKGGAPRGGEESEADPAAAAAAGMGTPEGLPRFQCPPDFRASRFAPGPPFSLEGLQDPSKELLLIKAPAHFSPESLDGHVLPLSGSQILKAAQSDGAQKVYSIQAMPGAPGSCARLLVPSGHQDSLTCAPPFSGSLSIWERFGDPTVNPLLFPVADRLAPQIPEGLKQHFMPFGGQLKRPAPGETAEKIPQKKKKKRRLHTEQYLGDLEEAVAVGGGDPETPVEELMPAAGGSQEREQNRRKLKKGAMGKEEGEACPEQDSQPHSSFLVSSQESLFSSEVPGHEGKKKKRKKLKVGMMESKERLADSGFLALQSEPEPEPPMEETSPTGVEELLVQHKQKKKKKKLKEEVLENKELLAESGFLALQAELKVEPPWTEISNSEEELLVQHKQKKKKKKKEEKKQRYEEEAPSEEAPLLMDPAFLKEETLSGPGEASGLSNPAEDSLGFAAGAALLGHKSKKKKKKEKLEEGEVPARGTAALEAGSLREMEGWGEPAALLEPKADAPGHRHKKKKKKEHKRETLETELAL